MIFKEEYIFLDQPLSDLPSIFKLVVDSAQKNQLVSNKKIVLQAFEARERLVSTAFEDGFAIPHARSQAVKETAVFYVRLAKPIMLASVDLQATSDFILLLIPETQTDYLEILGKIATSLLDQNFRKQLKTAPTPSLVLETLTNFNSSTTSGVEDESEKVVVGVSACATGVVHTYMARETMLAAGAALGLNIFVETQGQKGQEFELTAAQIKAAEVVVLATDIAVDTDRFGGKKIYKVGTKAMIANPQEQLKTALAQGVVNTTASESGGIFEIKNKRAWIGHIMSGVSFMIPFIVFAGITFAICTGIGKMVWGKWLDYSGKWDFTNGGRYTQTVVSGFTSGGEPILEIKIISGMGIGAMYLLNQFANIGFTVMMPIMGAYIANSIAGRAAIAPALILTFLANTPDYWLHYSIFAERASLMKGMGIFGALIFGFSVGYTVKWINTKWKINKYIKPIMPIIIIPLFVTLIYGVVWMFVLGNLFGLLIGYIYDGLNKLENWSAGDTALGMALVGLILGLIAGVDMGGPINKIASFSATALIFIDGGKAMGAAAASFAIAPLGCGLTALLFRKKFQADKELGVNGVILGFMGISEGAIPFAVKYTWAALVANIVGSGIAGMFAGLFQVSGWVGAWGGPIIALFGGVTTWDMQYIGILWYLLAIALGVVVHIFLFRILVEVQSKNGKLTKQDFKNIFKKQK